MSADAAAARARDAEARRAAQTVFDRPMALEAGAGTGKTATLVARIAAWCLGPGWTREAAAAPEEDAAAVAARVLDGVVAITFTEDAAAEMAERVARTFRALESWDGGPLPAALPGLLPEALPGADRTAARARALLVEIERLRTSTIHAFAAAILRRFPVEAGLHPAFTVDADESLVTEIVERTVETRLLAGYAAGEADALTLAEAGVGPAEVAEAARTLVTRGVPVRALEADPFTEERIGALLDTVIDTLTPCREALERLEAIEARAASDVRTARFLRQALAIASGGGPAPERFDALAEHVRDGFEDAKPKLRKWCTPKPEFTKAALGVLEDPGVLTGAVEELLPALETLGRSDRRTFEALRRVLLEILDAVTAEKRRLGVLVFQDLLAGARALLERDRGVLATLRGEIRQLLVDEMQDTDPEQARIVELLALDDGPSPRPVLFLVGDPKQSIYGWRSADLAVYEQLVTRIEAAGGVRHALSVNFRSAPPILDEVRRVVEPNMTERPGVQPPFVPLEPSEALRDDPGFTGETPRSAPVEHWIAIAVTEKGIPVPGTGLMTQDVARIEAAAIAGNIAALARAGEPYSEMAILMRSRTRLQPILQALRRHGIPYVVGRDRSFFRTREVVETAALVRLVADPNDTLALATVLRSPLAGVPDAALAPLWRENLPALAAGIGDPELPPEAEAAVTRAAAAAENRLPEALAGWPEALKGFLVILGRLRRAWRESPPDRFLETLRQAAAPEPLAAARFPGLHRLANVDRFLGDLEVRLLGGATAGELLGWLRRVARERPDEPAGRPREDAGEAVRVLTIHGAKGLEFRHVWLAGVDTGSRPPGTLENDAGLAGEDGARRWEFALAGRVTPGHHELAARRNEVADAEATRLLYVAMTRAKSRLVLSGSIRTRKTNDTKSPPFVERLRRRADGGGPEDPGWGRPEAIVRATEKAADRRVVQDGVLWRLITALDEPPAAGRSRSGTGPAAGCTADIGLLEGRRRVAAERQARPWLAGASAEAHRQLADRVAATVEEDAGPARDPGAAPALAGAREAAAAAGSAVHRLLERFDLEAADPDAELRSGRRAVRRWLSRTAAGSAEALRRLDEILQAFRSGPLWERWLGLSGHVIARELPVLLPPPSGEAAQAGPVGAVTGFIDLLYRDPASGDLVVADYKTDAPGRIGTSAGVHAAQLAPYARAIQEALGLPAPPRRELWFLAAGRIVRLD